MLLIDSFVTTFVQHLFSRENVTNTNVAAVETNSTLSGSKETSCVWNNYEIDDYMQTYHDKLGEQFSLMSYEQISRSGESEM